MGLFGRVFVAVVLTAGSLSAIGADATAKEG